MKKIIAIAISVITLLVTQGCLETSKVASKASQAIGLSSNTAEKVGGIVSGALSPSDGKVLGFVPSSTASDLLRGSGLGAEAAYLDEMNKMAELWRLVPQGMVINVEYRLKSTKQVIGLDDIERRVWFSNTSEFKLPTPDYGSKVKVNVVKPTVADDFVPEVNPTIPEPQTNSVPDVGPTLDILSGGDNATIK